MSDNSDLVMQTLLNQNQMLGAISAQIENLDKKLDTHVIDDNKVHLRVTTLEASHNRMKGAAAVWSLVVSAVVSGLGWYFGRN